MKIFKFAEKFSFKYCVSFAEEMGFGFELWNDTIETFRLCNCGTKYHILYADNYRQNVYWIRKYKSYIIIFLKLIYDSYKILFFKNAWLYDGGMSKKEKFRNIWKLKFTNFYLIIGLKKFNLIKGFDEWRKDL